LAVALDGNPLGDPLREHVSMSHFLVCVNQELLRNLRRGQAFGDEMVSPIAKRTKEESLAGMTSMTCVAPHSLGYAVCGD
jgi:hypothetical protein